MKRHTKIVLGLVVGGAAISALSLGVMAREKFEGRHSMMMSSGEHYEGGHAGYRYMAKRMGKLFEEHDMNSDGAVTQDEVDAVRKAKLAKFDADKDGALSLDEFEGLWLERMRSRMVDGFQRLDDDGSGKVTVEEFAGPLAKIISRYDTDDDGKITENEMRNHMKQRGSRHHKEERD